VDWVPPPHPTDIARHLITELGNYSYEFVGADHSEIACSASEQGVSDVVTKAKDTCSQGKEVSRSRIIQMVVGVVAAGLEPISGQQ
jgi:hypothetical protein